MTAFGKLIRTTAFRLTLVYLFLFALFAASLLGYFAWNTRRLINEQITATVNAEIAEIIDIYTRRGLQGLAPTLENRALRPGANLYLVTTPEGRAIGGNVGSLAPGVMASTGWSETAYRRLDEQDTAHHRALVRVTELTNGFRLLVGRDLEERRRLFGIVAKAAQWSLLVVIVLGIGGGIFVARRVLRRIDAMTGTTQAHHGRRPLRAAAGRAQRRRTRSPRGKPQCHAGAHRGADDGAEGSLRQHRP